MKIKFKKLNSLAQTPVYAKPGDAALDLVATSKETGLYYLEYGTGLSFEIPENHVGLLFPRSSITNTGLSLGNSVGVLDSGFRGEVKFRFYPNDGLYSEYSIGDRIGQILVLPYPTVEFEETTELTETVRGTGGYGSTNINIGDRVFINPDNWGTVTDSNNCNKFYVSFDDGSSDWCKHEWLTK